jgi:hypothetical protein
VNHAETDAELLRQAQAGSAPAFAILVHRYAALLHMGASSGSSDARSPGFGSEADGRDAAALDTVRRTFLRAMRRLDTADGAALGTWFLELQGTPLAADEAARAAPLTTAELDRLWGELAPSWPRGRRPRRLPRWLGHVAVVMLLLALSVAVPYALLVTAAEEEAVPVPVEEVVAVPIENDDFDLRFEDAPTGADEGDPVDGDPDEPDQVDGGSDEPEPDEPDPVDGGSDEPDPEDT